MIIITFVCVLSLKFYNIDCRHHVQENQKSWYTAESQAITTNMFERSGDDSFEPFVWIEWIYNIEWHKWYHDALVLLAGIFLKENQAPTLHEVKSFLTSSTPWICERHAIADGWFGWERIVEEQ